MSFSFKTRLERQELSLSRFDPWLGMQLYIFQSRRAFTCRVACLSHALHPIPLSSSRGKKERERDVSTHHQPPPECLCLPFLNISPRHAHLSFHPSILSHLHQLSITSLSSQVHPHPVDLSSFSLTRICRTSSHLCTHTHYPHLSRHTTAPDLSS